MFINVGSLIDSAVTMRYFWNRQNMIIQIDIVKSFVFLSYSSKISWWFSKFLICDWNVFNYFVWAWHERKYIHTCHCTYIHVKVENNFPVLWTCQLCSVWDQYIWEQINNLLITKYSAVLWVEHRIFQHSQGDLLHLALGVGVRGMIRERFWQENKMDRSRCTEP